VKMGFIKNSISKEREKKTKSIKIVETLI